MPSEDYMSDDFVASLLKKDAKESSIKYSAMGLQALLPKRPTKNAPKPNIRFLKNIIRDTDNHNAALKAKEAEDSRARLRDLRIQETGGKGGLGRTQERKHRGEDVDEMRRKQRRLDCDKDDSAERKPSRYEESPSRSSRRHRDDKTRDDSREGAKRHSTKREGDHRSRRHRSEHSDEADISDSARHRHRHHHRKHRHRSRSRSPARPTRHSEDKKTSGRTSRSPSRNRDEEHRKSRRRKHRSPSTSSEADITTRHRRSKPNHRVSPPPRKPQIAEDNGADSDPLEAIIGPLPPSPPPKIRARGRGAFTSASAMDAHFSTSYDPTANVRPNSDSENDWDQAFETLRDRQRWKQQGADRLRAAGFTEEEVTKWEKGGEKREEDVKWKGRGEGREWDRGKVVDAECGVDLQADWARLK